MKRRSYFALIYLQMLAFANASGNDDIGMVGSSLNDKPVDSMVAMSNDTHFRQFYISSDLPFSVKRGEVFAVPVTVFNNWKNAINVNVAMENTDLEYDFTVVLNETQEAVLEVKERVKQVLVPPNCSETVSFMIRLNKLGKITLKLKALTDLDEDTLHQNLRVEPEGVTQYKNRTIFLRLKNTHVCYSLTAIIPEDAVSGSEHLEFSAYHDVLGPTIKNLEKLVHLPHGCGEQNMRNLVQNILVLAYLETIKFNLPTEIKKAKKHMEVGYKRQFAYKHKNGAFSNFGEGNSEPSSWLTAFVIRFLIKAKHYITIDENVIDQALAYLISTQLESGQFKPTGDLYHPERQHDFGFTSFVLLALLEGEGNKKYQPEIEKGIKYLVDNIDKVNDTYELAIAAVVLTKTENCGAAKLMEKLEKVAHNTNNRKWWTSSSNYTSNDIEITAYIFQVYAYRSEPVKTLIPVINWILRHQFVFGDFDSTQDTVVALEALIKFAEKNINPRHAQTTINFQAEDSQGKITTKGSFTLDFQNSSIIRTHILDKSSRTVKFKAIGAGPVIIPLSYRYNLVTTDKNPSFDVIPKFHETPSPKILKFTVYVEFVPASSYALNKSNIAIMEINLPSGFTFNDIQNKPKEMKRVGIENLGTTIFIYFEHLEVGKNVYFDVNAKKTHAVAKQKPSVIRIYDYYNPEQRATVYYNVKPSLCSICDYGECGNCNNEYESKYEEYDNEDESEDGE